MPKCKNDPKKTYKGTEPSPKGFGYCAHNEKFGSERNGRDGNQWVVKTVGTRGVKRWVKKTCSKNDKGEIKLFYTKKIGGIFIHGYYGQYKVQLGKVVDDKFYKWESYGKFSKEGEKIPKWNVVIVPKKIIETFLSGKNGKQMKELDKLSKKKHYYIWDNGGRPFVVYIINGKVIVYKRPDFRTVMKKNNNSYDFMWDWGHYIGIKENMFYTKKLLSFSPKKIYIGESPKNPMTEYSGGYGKGTDGNSILLHLSGNKYVFVGSSIDEFGLQKGDSVEKFWSPIGNSGVPYPFIIGKNNIYFMNEGMYMSREDLPEGLTDVEMTDLYTYYYWGDKKRGIDAFTKKLKGFRLKSLVDRLF